MGEGRFEQNPMNESGSLVKNRLQNCSSAKNCFQSLDFVQFCSWRSNCSRRAGQGRADRAGQGSAGAGRAGQTGGREGQWQGRAGQQAEQGRTG